VPQGLSIEVFEDMRLTEIIKLRLKAQLGHKKARAKARAFVVEPTP